MHVEQNFYSDSLSGEDVQNTYNKISSYKVTTKRETISMLFTSNEIVVLS